MGQDGLDHSCHGTGGQTPVWQTGSGGVVGSHSLSPLSILMYLFVDAFIQALWTACPAYTHTPPHGPSGWHSLYLSLALTPSSKNSSQLCGCLPATPLRLLPPFLLAFCIFLAFPASLLSCALQCTPLPSATSALPFLALLHFCSTTPTSLPLYLPCTTHTFTFPLCLPLISALPYMHCATPHPLPPHHLF